MSCAKPAEPIEMPFGAWTLVGIRQVPDPPKGRGTFGGIFQPIGNIQSKPMLFSRWQQDVATHRNLFLAVFLTNFMQNINLSPGIFIISVRRTKHKYGA